jgi:pimeloyl-ACP methyl ester carboxylesterase
MTGHCRLLDPRSVRRAWGSFERCRDRLEEEKRRRNLPPASGEVVVVLHGLARTRMAMSGLAKFLAAEGGFDVCNVSYPSTRVDIATNARNLAGIVAGLAGAERVHFVGHSLGNIVVRHYLADRALLDATAEAALPPVGRMVMLAPPNQGAVIARRLDKLGLLRLVLGKSLAELGRDWSALERRLATPREFAIIAGGRGREHGYNPLFRGDDDLIVAVEETQLAGAAAFLVLPVLHAFIMNSTEARRQTVSFLRHGTFGNDAALASDHSDSEANFTRTNRGR